MTIRAATLLIALAAPAHAGPDRVSILTGSRHIGTEHRFQEVNPGLFLTWEDRAFGLDFSLGIFRNSFDGLSVAATAAKPVLRWNAGQIDLFLGIATYAGHTDKFLISAGDFVPIGGVQIRQGSAFLQIMPGGGNPEAVVSFGFTFEVPQ